ncbi:Rqc2 family fibronectin-binding protein [Pseudogracilibacillus sp. SO10305]
MINDIIENEVKEMPFDGIVTRAVTEDLQQSLIGGRINKIYQPTNNEIIMTVRNNRTNYTLLLSIHPSYARIHLTNDKFQYPNEPPTFCMVLRKHLESAIIECIEQYALERIISIKVRGFNEIGDPITKTFMLEIMGRHSNILLLNDDETKIINCMKHVPPFQNSYRTLLPGADYKRPPSQEKIDLLQYPSEKIVHKLDFNQGKIEQQLVQIITGISPFIAKEIVHKAHLGAQKEFIKAIDTFQEQVRTNQFVPTIYRKDREDFHVLPITYLNGDTINFDNVHEMLDAFYSNKAERDRVKQQAKDLERIIKNELQKNKKKLLIHEKTIEKAKKADLLQKQGELLTAHLHLVQKGDSSVTVIDYYDPEQREMTIELLADKTPSENAQRFFKQYRKLVIAKDISATEMMKTKKEIAYLEEIEQQIVTARDEDIDDIREELREEGYIKKQKGKQKRRKKPTPEHFISSDGTDIYVGRNNMQNEYVTHKLAHREDIWLHTLNIPGSHVIIKDSNPSEETLFEAAQIAAYYSKAQLSASVPVDYTKVKYVKKPSGSKPGFVTYTDQKTIHVTPIESAIKQLKVK